jgi:hypothetical protein
MCIKMLAYIHYILSNSVGKVLQVWADTDKDNLKTPRHSYVPLHVVVILVKAVFENIFYKNILVIFFSYSHLQCHKQQHCNV